eukprot:2903578-Alexandrium_andersonii.AAC.1
MSSLASEESELLPPCMYKMTMFQQEELKKMRGQQEPFQVAWFLVVCGRVSASPTPASRAPLHGGLRTVRLWTGACWRMSLSRAPLRVVRALAWKRAPVATPALMP